MSSEYGSTYVEEHEREKLLQNLSPGSRLNIKTKRYVGSSFIFAFILVAVGFLMVATINPSWVGVHVDDDDEVSTEPSTFDPSSVSSPADVLDGGWILVRCVSSSDGCWHPATDNLRGSDEYGSYADYRNDTTFSVQWETSDVKMFLFALTDFSYWLVTKKAQIFEFGSPTSSTVLVSSASDEAYEAEWYIRDHSLEDPWVSVFDHDADEPGMVYGENSKQGHLENLGSSGRGACVWVR